MFSAFYDIINQICGDAVTLNGRELDFMETQNEPRQGLIIGRNAVAEALKSGRAIDSLLVAKGEIGGSVGKIIAQCRERGIVVKETDSRKLDKLCSGENHQGVAAWAAVHEYSTLEDILEKAKDSEETVKEALEELDEWVKDNFKENNTFTIAGL